MGWVFRVSASYSKCDVTLCTVTLLPSLSFLGLCETCVNYANIQLLTTGNKNEQQQDVKYSTELDTKWTKTSLKTSDETINGGRNRSIET